MTNQTTYRLSKEAFTKLKSRLNGRIFWREENGQVIIKMVAPDQHIKQILTSEATTITETDAP